MLLQTRHKFKSSGIVLLMELCDWLECFAATNLTLPAIDS
jgi:hypothetical protein